MLKYKTSLSIKDKLVNNTIIIKLAKHFVQVELGAGEC